MRKHGIILDMNYDKFMFWLGHCQHISASNAPKVEKVRHKSSFIVENNTKAKLNPIPATVKYLKLLLYILPEHKNVSKIATFSKQILKWKITVPTLPKEKKL